MISLPELLILKQAGFSDEVIAGRLGCSLDEVEVGWKELLDKHPHLSISGRDNLSSHCDQLASLYVLVGESLKVLIKELNNEPTDQEIEACWDPDAKVTARRLRRTFLIFRPFPRQDILESLTKYLARVNRQN